MDDYGKEETVLQEDDEQKQTFKEKIKSEFRIDTSTISYKAFYFLFFAGFGASFPYMPLYFRQLGLNASLVGLLAGIRPLVQFASAPFWSVLSDKFRARKAVLLFSILSWLVMTLALLIPRPKHTVCVQGGDIVPTSGGIKLDDDIPESETEFYQRYHALGHLPADKMKLVLQHTKGSVVKIRRSNITNSTAERDVHKGFHLVRDQHEVNVVFIWLMVLIVVGEFLEAPTFILADTALLQKLQDRRKHYGKTRLFGSLGYAVASFIVGASLELTRYKYCGQTMNDYNYLFYIFAAVMALTFIFAAVLFKFNYEDEENGAKMDECAVWRVLLEPKYALYMLIAWFLGFSNGLIFNFLNWYLEDLGATKLLMGAATSMRATGLLIAFFLNSFITDCFGHVLVSLMSIFAYLVLFISLATMRNPMWAFPFEFLEGLTYGTAWSTCVTYMAEATPMSGAATMQGG